MSAHLLMKVKFSDIINGAIPFINPKSHKKTSEPMEVIKVKDSDEHVCLAMSDDDDCKFLLQPQ